MCSPGILVKRLARHDLTGFNRHLATGSGSPSKSDEPRPPPVEVPPPQFEPVCEVCDHYAGPVHPVCELIEVRLEAKAGRRGCCHGRVIAETHRVQREGGCPDGRF